MKPYIFLGALIALPGVFHSSAGDSLIPQAPVVRSVFFFSPTCPHCEAVMADHLPVFFRVYGGVPDVWLNDTIPEAERAIFLMSNSQLQMLLVDASKPAGRGLYDASMVSHPVERQREGVPRLIMGDSVLVGEREIPGSFHRLMRRALGAGGLGWPEIAGIPEALALIPEGVRND